jgi:hypothetical protein
MIDRNSWSGDPDTLPAAIQEELAHWEAKYARMGKLRKALEYRIFPFRLWVSGIWEQLSGLWH